MWIILALLSALFASGRKLQEKRLSNNINHYIIGWLTHLGALPLSLAITALSGNMLNPFQLGPAYWISALAVTFGFYPLNTFLYYQSLRHGELSAVAPIMSLWPVLSILPAWLWLGEVPSLLGFAGILATVAGVYALGLRGRRLHKPWQPFVESRSSRYALTAVLLLTAVGVIDKIGIEASNAQFFSMSNTMGAIFVLYGMIRWRAPGELCGVRRLWKPLLLPGNLQGLSSMLYFAALSAGPVAYVTAIRGSGGLVTSLLGVFVLHERFTTAKRLAFGLILVGSVLLALGG